MNTNQNVLLGTSTRASRFAGSGLAFVLILLGSCDKPQAPIDPPKKEKIADEPAPKPIRQRPIMTREGRIWIGDCYIRQAQSTADGRHIVALDSLGRIEVWDATTDTTLAKRRAPLRRLTGDEVARNDAPMAVVNRYIVYLAMSYEFICRDIDTEEVIWKKKWTEIGYGPLAGIFPTSAGELAIVSSKVVFLDARTGIVRREVDLHFQAQDRTTQLSADGSILLAAEHSRDVKRIDLSTGKTLLIFRQEGIGRIFMSRDGKRALILGESAYYCDLDRNASLGNFRLPQGMCYGDRQLATADADLSLVAIPQSSRAKENMKITVWDVKELKPLCDFTQDQVVGSDMFFSAKGGELMLAGRGSNSACAGAHLEQIGLNPYRIENAIVIFDWKRGVMLRTIAYPWTDTID